MQLKRTPYNVAIGRDWVYRQARRLTHTTHAISNAFMAVDYFFKTDKKKGVSNDSFEFINYIAIKYWLGYSLLQKSFQANIVFNDMR